MIGHLFSIAPERMSQVARAIESAWRLRQTGALPKAAASGQSASVPGVERVEVMGVMVRRADAWDEFFGLVGTDKIRQRVEAAALNANVKTIILHIDSPGGEVDGLAELADAVGAAAASKRVIAQVEGMAASAAYMTAAQATEIVAGRMDLIGSIGTRLTVFDTSRLAEKIGIKAIPIDTGEFKSTGEFGTEITDAQIEYLRGLVDGYFADFRDTVMRGRRLEAAAFEKVADGRVFLAKEAKSLGLIDSIATWDQTRTRLQNGAANVRNARARMAKMRMRQLTRTNRAV